MKNPKTFFAGLFVALGAAVFAEAATYRRALERVASMDPAQSSSVYSSRVVQLVYETLYEYDYHRRPYELRPSLAVAMPEYSEDRKRLIIKIDPEARFHDHPCFPGGKGRPVTAADAVYSLMRLGDSRLASPGSWLVLDTVEGMRQWAEATAKEDCSMQTISGLTARDDHTLEIRLTKPTYQFLWYLAMSYSAIVPREAVEYYGEEFGHHAVGSGPYRLERWRRNHQFCFSRVPLWRGWRRGPAATPPAGSVHFERLEFNEIGDVSTQWLCFLNGELDFLGDISRDNWDVVIDGDGGLSEELKARGISLFSAPTLNVMYIGINMDDPVLGKNKKLRQALNCAFDFDAWLRFYNGRVEKSDGPVPPMAGEGPEEAFAYAYDEAKAKRLLAEAGYPGGVDPATGRRLELTVDLGSVTQDSRETTELLASFYNRIGISLRAQYHNWPAFLERVAERRSQMFRIGWAGDYPDAENFLQLFYSKNVSPGPNRANYVNPAFDAVYERACAENDAKKRAELWKQAQRIIREDCPWIFLHVPKAYSLTGKRLKGYTPSDFAHGTERYLGKALDEGR